MNEENINQMQEAQPSEENGAVKKKKKKVGLIVLISILAVLILLAAGAVSSFFVMRSVGKNSFVPTVVDPESLVDILDIETFDEGKSISWKGKKYLYNENIVSVAFMGIDKLNIDENKPLHEKEGAGQCDTNMVMAFDTVTGKVSMIVVPRDTMVDVDVYDKSGNFAGIEKMQLCLAYSYGDGQETSCENAVSSMEKLLCGIDISSYAALDLRGIGSLNNAVGGVKLTSIEDIADFKEGREYHLFDDAARVYIQARDITKFNSDSLRRERQLQYAKAFASKAVDACRKDVSTVTKLYNAAIEYTCTDISLSQFTYLASTVLEAGSVSFDNIYVIEGEAVMGDRFMEVYPDSENVLETVLKVFYNEQ